MHKRGEPANRALREGFGKVRLGSRYEGRPAPLAEQRLVHNPGFNVGNAVKQLIWTGLSIHRLSTCLRMVFGDRLDDAKCAMKGRKHASSCSPGGTSRSNPIHERGQLSRSRQ